MRNEQLYYLGIKAIIQNDKGQVLLLKHHKGYWDFPGGRVSQEEDVNAALLREVFEETGLVGLENIQPDSMVLTHVRIEEFGLILWYHTCILKTEQAVILSDEHREYLWVDADAVRAMTKVSDIVAPRIL